MSNKVQRSATFSFLAGLIALLMAPTNADAAPAAPARPAVTSVCETGYRGMPEYDRKCLRTGTVLDGVNLWFRDGNGHLISATGRRAACNDATSTGRTRAGIIDSLYDVAYDQYRNHRLVLSVAGTVGVMDCQALGVKIK